MKSLSDCNHTVKLQKVMENDETIYLMLDYMQGGTLRDHVMAVS